MKKGQYVRCPVILEKNDLKYPRIFVTGQIIAVNEIAETAKVVLHDLYGSQKYYEHIEPSMELSYSHIERCYAMFNAECITGAGQGVIICKCRHRIADFEYYYVRLKNGEIKKFSEAEIKFDYTCGDYNPLEQMRKYEFHNPSWLASRLIVSRNMNYINNSMLGFDTISGCRTFLLTHQINTVQRLLESRPIRYMLADEVGLGKTIEACLTLKILQSENAAYSALIVVPKVLLNQWKSELKNKFKIEAQIYNVDDKVRFYLRKYSKVPIFALTALEDIKDTEYLLDFKWDMLVVDETHRLLKMPLEYDCIQHLSKKIENILLLSATPIQNRKDEYFNLLKLLEPFRYENITENQFNELVEKQEEVQSVVSNILYYMDDERYDDVYDELVALSDYLEDAYIRNYLEKFDIESAYEHISELEEIISYIVENYRIEKKVIRNRRSCIGEKLAQRKVEPIAYDIFDDFGNKEAITYRNLIDYLNKNNDGTINFVDNVVTVLLQAFFSSPWAFYATLENLKINDEMLVESTIKWIERTDEDIKNFGRTINVASENHNRFFRCIEWLEQKVNIKNSNVKIVVFTSFKETLTKLSELLSLQGINYVKFCKGMSLDSLEMSVYDFQTNDTCKIIICDETGGEGHNFQNADYIIHFDLPWTVNEIEQRIGRLDRLGREEHKRIVTSVVLYTVDTIEEQLFLVWKQGLEIFTNSLSGLEIITSDLNQMISEAISYDLENGLGKSIDEILDMTHNIREKVNDEQEYDAGIAIYRPLTLAIKEVLSKYQDSSNNLFKTAMVKWGTQSGLKTVEKDGAIVEIPNTMFGLKSAIQTILVPPNWNRYNGTASLKIHNKIVGTFDRKTAIKREDLLFYTVGDPVFDCIINNAINSFRGRSCAVITKKDEKFNNLIFKGFLFVFNVIPDMELLIENNIPIQLLSQFKVHFPMEQVRVYVPLGHHLDEQSKENLDNYLENPYYIRTGRHLGKRSSKDGEKSTLEKFMQVNHTEKWNSLLDKVSEVAYKKAKNQIDKPNIMKNIKKEMNRVLYGKLAECNYLGKNKDEYNVLETQLKYVYAALSNSDFYLDSICFLKVE